MLRNNIRFLFGTATHVLVTPYTIAEENQATVCTVWDGNLGYINMYDIYITILLLLCVNYIPVYKVQCKKSTTALMDRDDAEMFTVLLLIYELNNHHLQAE